MFISKSTEALASQFKALSDPQRLRIVALCRGGELSVSELTAVLAQSQPRVSQHLKLLCDAGILTRFRDGKHVYYTLIDTPTPVQRRLFALIPDDDERFEADRERVREIRGLSVGSAVSVDEPAQRAIAHALVELTLSAPLGDLLDVGCGRGGVLKLLASRARRAIGVDIDAEARNLARIELFMAGVSNCSLRQGDMYQLDFDHRSFDTIVLDDVLSEADQPARVLDEARRLLRPKGRLLVLQRLDGKGARDTASELAALSNDRKLRMAPPRALPRGRPEWLLAVLTHAETNGDHLAAGTAAAA